MSHPADVIAGTMNLVQISRSLRDFLFIGPLYQQGASFIEPRSVTLGEIRVNCS